MTTTNSADVISIEQFRNACGNCRLQSLCFVNGLSETERVQVERIITHQRPLVCGERLYHAGAPFAGVFVVRTGSIKTCTVDEDGGEVITGFHLPGELVGLDALATETHASTAEALDSTTVCGISYEQLTTLGAEIAAFGRQLLQHMAMEIVSVQKHLALLGKSGADARLAALLVDFGERFRAQGCSSCEFNLSMTRADIGNYLGLALETVSRTFTRFQQLGLIDVDRRYVKIRNFDGLRQFGSDSGDTKQSRSRL